MVSGEILVFFVLSVASAGAVTKTIVGMCVARG